MTRPGCPFCELGARLPDYVVCETPSWTLAHVDRLFPTGSLFLVSRRHVMLPGLSAAEWQEAAPLLVAASRMLIDVDGAERTYLASFSEREQHFHLLICGKQAEHSRARDGKIATALLAQLVAEGKAPEPGAVRRAVARYREVFERYRQEA